MPSRDTQLAIPELWLDNGLSRALCLCYTFQPHPTSEVGATEALIPGSVKCAKMGRR